MTWHSYSKISSSYHFSTEEKAKTMKMRESDSKAGSYSCWTLVPSIHIRLNSPKSGSSQKRTNSAVRSLGTLAKTTMMTEDEVDETKM